MIKLKKGDLVWAAGFIGYPDKCLTAEQVVVKVPGDSLVTVDRSVSCFQHKIKLPRSMVFVTSEEAILSARDVIRSNAAELEDQARRMRAMADAEPKVVPIEE